MRATRILLLVFIFAASGFHSMAAAGNSPYDTLEGQHPVFKLPNSLPPSRSLLSWNRTYSIPTPQIDTDEDGLTDIEEAAIGTDVNQEDSDGDGLLDGWEVFGVNGLDLHAWGASPLHKDIFIEMDYLVKEKQLDLVRPSDTLCDELIKYFKDAPVKNEDNSTGIRLHIQRQGMLPYKKGLENSFYDGWRALSNIKVRNFDSVRMPVFHYVLWALDSPDGKSAGSTSPNGSSMVISHPLLENGPTKNDDAQISAFFQFFGQTKGLTFGTNEYFKKESNRTLFTEKGWQGLQLKAPEAIRVIGSREAIPNIRERFGVKKGFLGKPTWGLVQYPELEIIKVVSNQIPGSECNSLPGDVITGNNPMLMATRWDTAHGPLPATEKASLRVTVRVLSGDPSKAYLAARQTLNGHLSESVQSEAWPQETLLEFEPVNAPNPTSDVLRWEIVAGFDKNNNRKLDEEEVTALFLRTPPVYPSGKYLENPPDTRLDEILIVTSEDYKKCHQMLTQLAHTWLANQGFDYAHFVLLEYLDDRGGIYVYEDDKPTTILNGVARSGTDSTLKANGSGLSHAVGANWDNNCEAKTKNFVFQTDSTAAAEFNEHILPDLIDQIIKINIKKLLSEKGTKDIKIKITPNPISKDIEEGGLFDDLYYTFKNVEMNFDDFTVTYHHDNDKSNTINVTHITTRGQFEDTYDFAYSEGWLDLAKNAAVVQAGSVTHSNELKSDATSGDFRGRVFTDKLVFEMDAPWKKSYHYSPKTEEVEIIEAEKQPAIFLAQKLFRPAFVNEKGYTLQKSTVKDGLEYLVYSSDDPALPEYLTIKLGPQGSIVGPKMRSSLTQFIERNPSFAHEKGMQIETSPEGVWRSQGPGMVGPGGESLKSYLQMPDLGIDMEITLLQSFHSEAWLDTSNLYPKETDQAEVYELLDVIGITAVNALRN